MFFGGSILITILKLFSKILEIHRKTIYRRKTNGKVSYIYISMIDWLITFDGSDGVSDQFHTSIIPVSDPQKALLWKWKLHLLCFLVWNRSETLWKQRIPPAIRTLCCYVTVIHWSLGDITDSYLISLILINIQQLSKIRSCPRRAVDEPYTSRMQQKCWVQVSSRAWPRRAVY